MDEIETDTKKRTKDEREASGSRGERANKVKQNDEDEKEARRETGNVK